MLKSNKKIISVTLATLTSVSLVVSCAAPGSSKKIKSDNPIHKIVKPIIDPNKFKEITPEPIQSNPISPVDDIKVAKRAKSNHFIALDQKINYLALGDSITAGFDGALPQDFPGEFLNNTVTGVSYPAFLARIFNKAQRLNSFNNYAVSGTTALDWLSLLNNTNNQAIFENNVLQNKINLNQLKQDLAKANLITLTIGANDFLYLLFKSASEDDLLGVIKNLISPNRSVKVAVDFLTKVFEKTFVQFKHNIDSLIKTLKQYAPNANINLISYPTPFLAIKDLINQKIASLVQGINIDVFDTIIDVINGTVKDISNLNNVNYINVFNKQYWESNLDDFTSIYFDIHPSIQAYKKMAQDIYLKITNPSLKLSDYAYDDFNQKYLNSDALSAKYQIETTNNPKDLLGASTKDYLGDKDANEKQDLALKDDNNFGIRIQELSNTFSQIVVEMLNFALGNSYYKELDPDGYLRKIFFNDANNHTTATNNSITLADNILNSSIIQTTLFNLQTSLKTLKQNNELNFNSFIDAIKNTILSETNVANLVASLTKNNLIINNQTNFKLGLKSIISNFIKLYSNDLITNLLKANSNKLSFLGLNNDQSISDFASAIERILKSNEFTNLTDKLIDTFILNSSNFNDVKSYKDLIIAFLYQNLNNVSHNPNLTDFDQIQQQHIQAIKNVASSLNQVIYKALTEIKQPIIEALFNLLKHFNLVPNNQETIYHQAVSDVVDFVEVNLKDFNIISDFVYNFLISFNTLSLSDISQIAQSAFQLTISNTFGGEQGFNNISKLITKIAQSKFIQNPNNKQLLKDFLHQIVKQKFIDQTTVAQKANLLLSIVPNNVKDQINNFLGDNALENVINLVLKTNITVNNQQANAFEATVVKLIDVVLDNFQNFANKNNLNEIIFEFVKLLNVHLLPLVKQTLNNIVSAPNINHILTNIIDKMIAQIINKQNADTNHLANDLATELISILTKNNNRLLNSIIDNLSNVIRNSNPSNIVDNLKNSLNSIVEIIKSNVLNNQSLAEFIIQKIKSPLFTNNKAIIIEIIQALIIQQRNNIINLIKNNLPNLTNKITNYADLTEVNNLINLIIDQPSFFDSLVAIVPDLINNLASNNAFLDKLLKLIKNQSFDISIIEDLANNTNLLDLIKQTIKPILANYIAEGNLNNTIALNIKNLAANNGIVLANDYVLKLTNWILDALKTTNKFNLLIDNVFNLLSKPFNINNLINQLPNTVLNSLNLADWELISNIFNKFKNADNEFKNQTKQIIANALDLPMVKNLIVQQLNSNTQLSWIFNNITNKQEFINQLITILLRHKSYLLDKALIAIDQTNIELSLATKDAFINQIVNNLLNNLNLNEFIFTVLNSVSTTEFNNIKANLVIVLENVLNNRDLITKLLGNINSNLLSASDTLYFYNLIWPENNSSLKQAIHNTITNVVNNYKNQNINNLDQLISYIVSQIDDSIKQPLNDLINNLANNQVIKQLVVRVLSNFLKLNFAKFYDANLTTNLIADLVNNVVNILKQNHLYQPLFDKAFELFNANKNNLNNLKTIPNQLLNYFLELMGNFIEQNNISSKWFNLIKSFKQSPIFSNNKQYILSLINKLLDTLDDSTIQNDLINNLINNLASFSTEEKSTLKNFILSIINSDNHLDFNLRNLVSNLINSVIDYDLNNQTLNLRDFIFKFIKDINFLDANNKFMLNKLLEKVLLNLNDDILNLILTKSNVNNVLSSNNLASNNKITVNTLKDLKEWIISLNTNQNIINLVLDQVSDALLSSNDFQQFINLLVNKLKDLAINNFAVVKSLLASNVIKHNSLLIKELANNLINKFLNQQAIHNLLTNIDANTKQNIASALNLQVSDIDQFINNFINNQTISTNINTILHSLSQQVIQTLASVNDTDLASINSYSDLVKYLFKQEAIVNSFKTPFKAILLEVIRNNTTKQLLNKIIANTISSESLRRFFEPIENKEQFAGNLLSLYDILDQNLNLSDLLFETLINSVQNNGLNFNATSIINSLIQGLKQIFAGNNFESKVLTVIKAILSSDQFKTLKSDVLKIVNHLFKNQQNIDLASKLIFNLIPSSIKDKILTFVNQSNFINLIGFVLRNDDFNQILTSTISSLLSDDNITKITQTNSFNDLIKVIINSLDINNLSTKITNLINSLINNDEINNIIVKFIKDQLVNLNINITTKETQLDALLKDLINNLIIVIKNLDIINPVLTTVFDNLKLAIDNANPASVLAQIPAKLQEILNSKISTNKNQFIIKVLDSLEAPIFNNSNHINTLNWLVDQIIDAYSKNNQIALLINNNLDSLKSNTQISQWINFDQLSSLINTISKNSNFTTMLKQIAHSLIANRNWKNDLDNIFVLVKNVVSRSNLKPQLITDITNIFNFSLSNNNFANLIQNAIETALRQQGINLQNLDLSIIVQSLITDFNNFLNENTGNTTYKQKIINLIFDSFNNANDVNQWLNNFKNGILTIFNFNNFDLIKQIIFNLKTIVKHNQELKNNIINQVVNYLKDNNQIKDTLASLIQPLINNVNSTDANFIDKTEIISALNSILNLPNLQNNLSLVYQRAIAVLTNYQTNKANLNHVHSWIDILKDIFNDASFNNTFATNAKQLLFTLLNDSSIKNIVAKQALQQLTKLNLKDRLFTNVSNPKVLIEQLIPLLDVLETNLADNNGLIAPLILDLANQIGQNGLNISTTSLFNIVKTKANLYFNYWNSDARALDLFKDIFKQNDLITNKQDLLAFIKNAVSYALSVIGPNLGTNIWNNFPEATRQYISTNFISQTEFTNIINQTINIQEINTTIVDLINYLLSNPSTITNANSVIEILKNYLSVTANETTFKQHLKNIFIELFKTNAFRSSLKNIIKEHFLNLTLKINTNKYDAYLQKVAEGFGDLIQRWEIIDPVINAMVNAIKTKNSIYDFTSTIKDVALANLDIKDFNVVKKILNDPLISNNKEIVKQLLDEILDRLISNEIAPSDHSVSRIGLIIKDLNLAYLILGNNDAESYNIVNKTIESFLTNEHLRKVFKIILHNVIDHSSSYTNAHSWIDALNVLVRSQNSNELKEQLKQWIKTTFDHTRNSNSLFFKGLAKILVQKMQLAGYAFNNTSDVELFTKILKGVLKEFVSKDYWFNDIFNNIYSNIQKTTFKQGVSGLQLKQAIIEGLLSPITYKEGNNNIISLHKIFNLRNRLPGILNSFGENESEADGNYVKLMTRLFEVSDYNRRTGIYQALAGILNLPSSSHSNNRPSNNNNNSNTPAFKPNPFVFKQDENIFHIIGNAAELIASLYRPVIREMISKAYYKKQHMNWTGYNVDQYWLNDEYKLLFRLNLIIMWFLNNQGAVHNKFIFWNGLGQLSVVSTLGIALNNVFESFMRANSASYKEDYLTGIKLKELLNDNKWSATNKKILLSFGLGEDLGGWTGNWNYLSGNTSYSQKWWNYSANSVPSHLWYLNDANRFKKNRKNYDILFEALKKGYLNSYEN
ncbi:hypothetical protein GE118_01500 [Mycoplasma sp. NEAQ87857]|uniref:SGNH/GDSL hydrolase family protein n=1 Tax=Mycoplasma sp. NEAQ87857 TaxID=2683967 RepID=UPI001317B2D1|nr:SGNH/GDSL hydrolase family protein [Mycoplasma sp. NEAQ87857]QGZ97470.1 hypothetical protein GE118_01500 [Mycoplasma sp. NEAQ87857]